MPPVLTDISLVDEELKRYREWGILPTIRDKNGRELVSRFQTERVSALSKLAADPTGSLQLFPSELEIPLSETSALIRTAGGYDFETGADILLQLLPGIIQRFPDSGRPTNVGAIDIPGTPFRLLSRNANVLSTMRAAIGRFTSGALTQTAQFSRSASYMGSKAALGPALSEILLQFSTSDTVVLDLMCGSGASAGAFSRHRKVIASDAQQFSCLLATVQGGGMTARRAEEISEYVTTKALEYYVSISKLVERDIAQENDFLTTEISPETQSEFMQWVRDYPRVGGASSSWSEGLSMEVALRRQASVNQPATLFVRYYANLFFGVRQAAEIDALRSAIDTIDGATERNWALGALVCAVSACADSYAGHFAQPRINPDDPTVAGRKMRESIFRRSASVMHEFTARMQSLGAESERARYAVDVIPGPWDNAITELESTHKGRDVMVYLDPPYTRDEYSRYYHVLETLVKYDYPLVSGKGSVPIKSENGRFASEFFSRNIASIEGTLSRIVERVLKNGWSCMWSYSNSGVADIESVIGGMRIQPANLEIFSADYSYKAQGRHSSKRVTEHVIFMRSI